MLKHACSLLVASAVLSASAAAHAGFELQPMVGYSFINMTGFSEDQFLAAAPTDAELAASVRNGQIDVQGQVNSMLDAAQIPVEGDGLSAGIGAQLSLWIFVLGARYSYSHTPDFGFHTVGGDLGLRFGEKVALYGRGGVGFAMVGGLPEDLSANGFYVDMGVGLDIVPSKSFSFGFGAEGELLFLGSTSQLESAAQAVGGGINADTIGEVDGSAIGYLIRPQVHFTWHL